MNRGLVGGPFGSSLVSSDYADDGIPVIRGTNMGCGRYVGGEFAYVSTDKFDRDLSRNVASARDIVFTQRGTLGQVALVPESRHNVYVISQSQMRLRVDPEKASPEFVYYAATSPDFLRQIHDRAISTGVPHTNLGILAELEVPDLPLLEQQAIAEVLGALDDKIAANTRLAATAETFATTLVATCSKAVPLSGLAELSKAQSNPALFGAKLIDHYSLPAFDASALPVIEPADQIKSNKFVINQDVVLLSKLNPRFPRVWRAGVNPDRVALASTEFLVLNPVGVSREILWAALSQPTFATALDAKVAGTSGSHQRVRPVDALATLVADPRGLDAARTAALEAALGLASKSRAENRTLAAIRDALLPKLMSGQLRVTDVDRFVDTATATPLETTDKDRS